MLLDQLLDHPQVVASPPASQAEIDAVAARFGTPLPDALIGLWQRAAHLTLGSLNARLLAPTEVLELADTFEDYPLVEQGWLPLLDDQESNYLIVMLREPLAYRVAYLMHDSGCRLMYRDLSTFLAALLISLETDSNACGFFHTTRGDYAADAPRSIEDQTAARALLATANKNREWNFAISLLDAENLTEWAKLLESDYFVRHYAIVRLRQMTASPIRALLQQDELAFTAFLDTVRKAALAAGWQVSERHNESLRIENQWFNLDACFYRRHIPNALPRLLAWIDDVLAGRNPHDRPGHFMTD